MSFVPYVLVVRKENMGSKVCWDASAPRSDRPGTGGQPIGGQSWGGVDQSEARDDGRCYPVVVTSVTAL